MHSTFLITLGIVILVLAFDFINGFHDTATAVATSISTRALTPGKAIILCAVFNFIGALTGTAVAKTVGENIVSHNSIPQWVIMAVLLSAIAWNLFTWYFGIPSSSSHALIGALVGGGIGYNMSFDVVNWSNLFNSVIIWIFISPLIGFVVGYLFMTLLNWILKPFKVHLVNRIFQKLQILSGAFMALEHGGNDAQKSMGMITMALLSGGYISTFEVPTWVILACAVAMGLGTSIGGHRIIKTMGSGMAKLTPVNGFAAQAGSAAVIFTATLFHAPVSTTHIVSTTIMGVGASRNVKKVKWGVAKNIVWAWVITIPVTALVSAFFVSVAKIFV